MICRIKVKIYPKSRDQSVSVRYAVEVVNGTDVRVAVVTFTLQKPSQLNFMASELEKFIMVKDVCELEFVDVPDNNEFRATMRKILCSHVPNAFVLPERRTYAVPDINYAAHELIPKFAAPVPSIPSMSAEPVLIEEPLVNMEKVNMQRAARLIPTMRLHVKEHGANPDFTVMHTEKNRKKIWNYIKSATAQQSMTLDEALYIASQI